MVIPVHDGADRTEACLRAVAATDGVPYEVIVVDDDADAATRAVLRSSAGLRVVPNHGARGFLHSANAGAAAARGPFLMLLNNGNEPRKGWLAALLRRANSDPAIAVVVPKLVNPGGLLHEAGGMLWRDGTAWKYGNAHEESDPAFNYVRETDYGSGEALLVRAEVWRAVGGLDERFSPGYWGDVDLCLAARGRGHRVVYEPGSVVVHRDDGTAGLDPFAAAPEQRAANQRAFTDKWREGLGSCPEEPSHDRAYLAAHDGGGPVALVVDHRLPDPDRDAGSARLWAMLECLKELGCSVALVADDQDVREPSASRLRGMGVEVLAGPVAVAAHVQRLGHRLDLAVLCRPYVAPRHLHEVRRFAPRARVAYDTVDLHFLREERRIAHEGGTNFAPAEAYREIELGLIRAADVTFVAGSHERELLRELVPDAAVELLPNSHEVRAEVAPRAGRAGQLFVGGFEHDPNVDAALHLGHDIMPLLRKELGGEASLSIVGSDPPPEVLALAASDVEVTGWVEDLDPLLGRAMVSVAPLRYGAGMKGKVTQSLAAGLPVVTTSVGAEGLEAHEGHDLLVADDAEGFARGVAELHRDSELWEALSQNGRALAARVASLEPILAALRAALGERLR